MEQIVVWVKNKEKAQMLLELLTALDFVDSVKTNEIAEVEVEATTSAETLDFFSLAGLWQGRDVTVESIRHKALNSGLYDPLADLKSGNRKP